MSDTRGSWDPEWERIFQRRPWGKYPPEHVVRFIARHFYGAPDRRAVRLLDLGCASGAACTWFMAREGFTVSAIDASQTAVKLADERVRRDGLAADVRHGDIVTLPWPDATFDGVVDNQCLCCNPFETSRRIVAEVHRVLKTGGWFHSATFSDRCSDYGRGPATEPGGFSSRDGDGPLSGDFFTRFSGRPQIEMLYAPFTKADVDTESHSIGGGSHYVESWIITCQKRTNGL